MLTSLIFVALAAAWLVVLVPMFARRRQEVTRTTDAQLSARVIHRGGDRNGASRNPAASRRPVSGLPESNSVEPYRDREVLVMPDTEWPHAEQQPDTAVGYDIAAEYDTAGYDGGQGRRLDSADARAGRRYRPGRGGFDPEAAAVAARTKYARRQRIVLAALLAAVGTAVLAALAVPKLWWLHGAVDLLLVGYLTYLRTQVRIEEDVRRRRLARLADEDDGADQLDYDPDGYADEDYADEYADGDYADGDSEGDFDEGSDYHDDDQSRGYARDIRTSRDRSGYEIAAPSNAFVLGIDDEDPMFDELDERTWEPYRRAAGE